MLGQTVTDGRKAINQVLAITARLLLLCTIVLLPLIRTDRLLDPNLLPGFVFLAIVAIIVLIVLLIQEQRRLSTELLSRSTVIVFTAFAVYILLTAVSGLWALNSSEAYFETARAALWGIIFLVAWRIATPQFQSQVYPKVGVREIIPIFTVSGLLQSIIGLAQYFDIAFQEFSQHGGFAGTLANKGLLSSYLSMIIPFAVYGALNYRGIRRVFSSIASAIILFTIIIAQTRSAWIALISATVVVSIVHLISNRIRLDYSASTERSFNWRSLALPAVALLIIGSAAIFMGARGEGNIFGRLASVTNMSGGSVRSRLTLWDTSLQMIADHPAFGVGAGNWKISVLEYPPMTFVSRPNELTLFRRPHNDYLWVWSEIGIVGLVAFLTILLITLARLVAFIIRRSPTKVRRISRGFAGALLFALVSYCTDSFFSFPKERVTHLAMLAVILGISLSFTSRGEDVSASRISRRILYPICLALAVAVLIVGIIRARSEYYSRGLISAYQKSNWTNVIALTDRSYSPFYNLDETTTPLHWYQGAAYYSLGNFQRARVTLTRAIDEHPYHPYVLNTLGSTFENLGDHDEAIRLYNKALEINPRQTETRLNLASAYFNKGDYYTAREVMDQVAPLDTQRYREITRAIDEILRRNNSSKHKKRLSE